VQPWCGFTSSHGSIVVNSTIPPQAIVRLVNGATITQKAAQEVSARILGPKPEDDESHKGWERRRKKLSTHLTRGRKWSRLVEELGYGILLKNAWYGCFSKEMMVD
jgi:hypothetical protein